MLCDVVILTTLATHQGIRQLVEVWPSIFVDENGAGNPNPLDSLELSLPYTPMLRNTWEDLADKPAAERMSTPRRRLFARSIPALKAKEQRYDPQQNASIF